MQEVHEEMYSSPLSSSRTEEMQNEKPESKTSTSASSVASAEEKQAKSPKPEKLDPDRLKRRETLRAQFGFRRSMGQDDDATPMPSKQNSSSSDGTSSKNDSASGPSLSSASPDTLRRHGTISSALSSAFSRASETPAFMNLRAAVGNLNEPRHIRMRKEAEAAEQGYKDLVRQLDRARCSLEDILAEHFGIAERWESNRLRAVQRVLSSFSAAFTPLLPTMSKSLQQIAIADSSLDIETALTQMVAKTRLGQYTPRAEVFQPYYHDDASSLTGAGLAGFGMDLVAYVRAEILISENTDVVADGVRAGSGALAKGLPPIPLALAALLGSLERRYSDEALWTKTIKDGEKKRASLLANEEKRRAWIYEVPLPSVHLCREAIISHLLGNSVPGANVGAGLDDKLKRFDAPTLAATVKLWALELADSLVPMRMWDTVVSTYHAAAEQERDAFRTSKAESNNVVDAEQAEDLSKAPENPERPSNESKGKSRAEGMDPVLADSIRKQVLSDLEVILGRLPKIHLVCLDAIVGHLSRLIKATPTEESDSLFVNKVALSLARAIVRPGRENPATLRSLSPVLLAYDLIMYYDDLLPKILDAKAKDGEKLQEFQRKTPIRKRTKPVDQRISRSSIARSTDMPPMPLVPFVEEQETAAQFDRQSDSRSAPAINTAGSAKTSTASAAAEEEQAATPLANRTLPFSLKQGGNSKSSAAPAAARAASTDKLAASTAQRSPDNDRALSPSNASDASAYDTPDEDDKSKTTTTATDATSSAKSEASMAKSDSTAPSKGAHDYDEDKPLSSNVARLSRQFGKMGSNQTSGNDTSSSTPTRANASSIGRGSRVRGPRPAN
jgi:hypothetical protein